MPADDLVLNVRQISNYTETNPQPNDNMLLQRGGLGGPYLSVEVQNLVAVALAYDEGPPMGVGVAPPANSANSTLFTGGITTPFDGLWMWNSYIDNSSPPVGRLLGNGPWGVFRMDPIEGWQFYGGTAGGAGSPTAGQTIQLVISPIGHLTVGDQISLARDPVGPMEAATAQWVTASTVNSFNGRVGPVNLWITDILAAGGAPQFSPVFGGEPRAPTPPPQSNSSRLATTGFVQRNSVLYIQDLLDTHPFVFTFNGRSGEVVLTAADLDAVIPDLFNNVALTGVPTAPTAVLNTASDQIATTQFVVGQIANSGYAPLDSPNFTGYATSITPPPGTNTGQIATTAFVQAAVAAGVAGVASFNGRVGAVILDVDDITTAGGAPIASPAFTGVPTAPTAAPGTATTQLATTAFVLNAGSVSSFNTRTGAIVLTAADITGAGGAVLASPTFTGTPAGPTATTGTNTTQLATTAFVMNEINAVNAGVISFNGRTGVVNLNSGDVSAAGGATLSSPAFTGVPTAPTAAVGTSTTQLATTAFVAAAIAAAPATVASFNGRTGAVTLTAADITAANPAYLPLAGGTLTGFLTLPSMPAAGSVANKIDGASGSNRMLFGATAGSVRWGLVLGNSAAEAAGNVGSDFALWGYGNAGASIGAALTITRASLAAAFAGTVASPQIYFGWPSVTDFFAGVGGTQIRAINFSGNGTYSFNFNLTTGVLSWLANSAVAWQSDFSGNFTIAAVLTVGGQISCAGASMPGSCNAGPSTIGGCVLSAGTFATGSGGAGPATCGGVTLQSNNVYANSGTVFAINFSQVSDQRLKKDIAPASAIEPALTGVNAVPVHQFHWETDDARAPLHIGWMADEVQAAFPNTDVVAAIPDGTLTVNLSQMVAILWQAVQELTAKVATLEGQPA